MVSNSPLRISVTSSSKSLPVEERLPPGHQPSYVSGRSVTCRLLSRWLRGAPFCSRLCASLFVTSVLRNRGGHERVASNVSKRDASRNSAWDRYRNGISSENIFFLPFFPEKLARARYLLPSLLEFRPIKGEGKVLFFIYVYILQNANIIWER